MTSVDDEGNWIVRKDVRNVFFNNGSLNQNDWLTAENGNGSGKFGPEIGIGNYLGHTIDAPVTRMGVMVTLVIFIWWLLVIGKRVNGVGPEWR